MILPLVFLIRYDLKRKLNGKNLRFIELVKLPFWKWGYSYIIFRNIMGIINCQSLIYIRNYSGYLKKFIWLTGFQRKLQITLKANSALIVMTLYFFSYGYNMIPFENFYQSLTNKFTKLVLTSLLISLTFKATLNCKVLSKFRNF